MYSNKLPTVPLPPPLRAPLPPLVRAPLSSEDNNSVTSGSELDPLSTSDDDDDDPNVFESGPGSAPDASRPVARLTKDDDDEEAETAAEEVFDVVDGDGFVVRFPVLGEVASSVPNPSSEFKDDDSEVEVFDEVDGDGFPIGARVSSQAEEIGNDKGRVLVENPNAGETAEKDEFLSENLNLSENLRRDVADEYKFGDSMDGTDKENGDVNAPDEKDEIFGRGSEQMNSISNGEIASKAMELRSNTIELDMDKVEEDSKHKKIESKAAEIGFENAIDLDDENGSVMDSGKFDSYASKLEDENENSDITANSADTHGAVNETQISLVEDKAASKLKEDSIESEAKLKYGENGNLFVDSSKTNNTGKVTGETRVTEGVENMDEKGAKEGARRQISDEGMITKPKEGPSSSLGCPHNITKEIVRDEEKEKDFASLLERFRAATSSSTNSNNTITTFDATGILSANHPAGLGSSVGPLKPAQSEQSRPIILASSNLAVASKSDNPMTVEEKKFHEKVEVIRIKFLRLVHRLGHSPEGSVATSVLYHLARTEDMKYWMFSFQTARKKALELEREEKDKLDFSCNILVIGKAGVGKSATINSIFEEEKSNTNAFKSETSVRKIEGIVDGIKIRFLDTPGLKPSLLDQAPNRKILSSVKKFMKRCPPDVVLYMDRFDTQTRDSNDLPVLRSITSTLGLSIWLNVIITLTHAATAPPEGPTGLPLSYEATVGHRSHILQQSIQQATGDMRLMNPVVLVENHPSCRRNREGQRVLPNGSSWRSELLLLCYASKILSEANSLSTFQDSSVQKLFKFRFCTPPMQFFLSSLLESKPHPKLSSDQGGNDHSDIDLDEFLDQEDEEDEYDQLPPFYPLSKSQIAKLTKEHKRAYFDEYDYRVRLQQKKQWKEEIKRLKEMKRGKNCQGESVSDDIPELFDDSPTTLQTPLPDMVLPPSFDSDNPVHRYRFLEPSSQFLTGFLLDTHGWDHDYGYDEVSLEKLHAIAAWFPAAVSVRLRKDKNDFSIHLDSSVSAKHGESGSSLASFDIQTIGKQMAYFFRGETMFRNLKKNKTAAGVSLTFLGDTVATGLKLEDHVSVRKRVNLGVSMGAVRAEGDVAYGANLEAILMKKDYPIGQALATLGLSLVRYHGDLAYGGSLQSEVSIRRNSKMTIHVGMNNKKSGQITIRTSSSDQLEIVLMALIPIAMYIFRRIWHA